MKVRLAILTCKDPGFWDVYVPQSETRIIERIVEIPDLPPGWTVSRVMVCDPIDEED